MTMKILVAALLAATLTLGVTQDAAAQQKSNPFKTGGDLAHACAYYRADPSALTPLQLIQMSICTAYLSGATEMYATIDEDLKKKDICFPKNISFNNKGLANMYLNTAYEYPALAGFPLRDAVYNALSVNFPCEN
ncbi:Rap1a/Tai family immunity protein [Terasakiella pusilla]|uniref:Rap1a/Tai family immunity protein n=1 Tax=Terasakiella pusilla TaxID=64973 RepID=UPI003AA924F9